MKKLFEKEGVKSVASSIICIIGGLLVGLIVMIILSFFIEGGKVSDAFKGLGILLQGPFSAGSSNYVLSSVGNMIFYSAPLIMTGVSVAIAYKTGLFNIGAAGQFLMGTLASLLVALNFDCTGDPMKGFLVWVLAILVACAAGMLWGAIPGFFKAFFNVNEVIVCIMTNWIAANITSWVFSATPNLVNNSNGKSAYLITTKLTGTGTPTLGLDKLFNGSYMDISIFVAIIIAIVIYIMLNKTTFGYELRACGANKHGARYAGMNEKRNIILSMAIAGALAGIGGALYYLNPGVEFKWKSAYSSLPNYGFNGIPVALLASNNPIAVIFVGIYIRFLSIGGDNLTSAGFNKYIADVVIALIIYFAGFSKLFRDFFNNKKKLNAEPAPLKKAADAVNRVAEAEEAVSPVSENNVKEDK